MTGTDWFMIGWLVIGVVVGLVAANWVYDKNWVYDNPNSLYVLNPGPDAAITFVCCVLLCPLVVAAGISYLLLRAGAWLLPAYRAEHRAKRQAEEEAEETAVRAEIDRLHARLGLPPVDWQARTP